MWNCSREIWREERTCLIGHVVHGRVTAKIIMTVGTGLYWLDAAQWRAVFNTAMNFQFP
jgi:hypothetical protein